MKHFILLLLLLSNEFIFAQNTQIRIIPSVKNSSIILNVQEPFVAIEGYDGDEIIMEAIPGINSETPPEAAGLRQIPIPNRDKDKYLNILNPKVNETIERAIINISLPACNCRGIIIKVPKNPYLSVTTINNSGVGELSIKNINNEVHVSGWSPLIKLSNVSGFSFSTGGAKPGKRVSDKIILSDIKWTNEPVIINGKSMPRRYLIGSSSASIDLTLPSDLKANIIYRMGNDNSQVFSDLNLASFPASEDQIKQFGESFSKDLPIRAIPLNGGGINIDISTADGNIYLRKQQ